MRDNGASRSLRRTKTMRGKTTTATARTLNLQRRGPAGLADSLTMPGSEAFKRSVLACICPFCGAGPFKVLAIHTTRAHATDRRELRELAGLLYSDSITSPDYHAEKSALAKRLHDEGRTLRPEHVEVGRTKKGRQLSPAAREIQRQKAVAAHEADPDLGRRANQKRHEIEAERMRPLYERVVSTYEAVLAERGMAYGAVAETARRLGWPTARTLRRIEAAWNLGLGHHDRTVRGSEELRICRVCGEHYTVTRSRGWKNKTCSSACGARLNGERSKKPPRETRCKICGETFSYERRGSAERSICDQDECRREVSRRAGQRSPSEETRRKISAARRGVNIGDAGAPDATTATAGQNAPSPLPESGENRG